MIKEKQKEVPVIILSAQDKIMTAVNSIKEGALDYFTKPLDTQRLDAAVRSASTIKRLSKKVADLEEQVDSRNWMIKVNSQNEKMKHVHHLMMKLRESDVTVLIQGESGTGKEMIAQSLHNEGNRASAPFITINCASIPKELLETELFGHEKGSYTGAFQRKIGKFEIANGGTIFLDEIGDLEFSLQAKMLRVLQYKEFQRVGGNETLSSDVRILAATNQDLRTLVLNGKFREDLYYRLASFPIILPPLRERKEDIPILVEHFLEKYSNKGGKKKFSRKTLQALMDYSWPGNIRELEHAIERAILISDGEFITIADLPMPIQTRSEEIEEVIQAGSIFRKSMPVYTLETIKKEMIAHAIAATKGNIKEAAKRLNLSRATVYTLCKQHGIAVLRSEQERNA
jgi:DNA-binding NtrC family response regulator